jgi:hypothetical protein
VLLLDLLTAELKGFARRTGARYGGRTTTGGSTHAARQNLLPGNSR